MRSSSVINESASGSSGATIIRFSIYTVGILLLAVALPWLAQHREAAAFKENGAVEWLQLGFLVAVTTMFFRESTTSPQYRHVFIILACLSAFAGAREMDAILDVMIPWIGWKAGYAFIVFAGMVGFTNQVELQPQIRRFLNSRAFSLLWAGFIVAIPFAQLVGNGAFLQAIMSDDYSRDYRRMIEEIGELMGYGLLVIGSRELILHNRKSIVS